MTIPGSQVNIDIQPELKERTKKKHYHQLKCLESSLDPEASKTLNKEGSSDWIKLILRFSVLHLLQ
jgi:hypothetical protein